MDLLSSDPLLELPGEVVGEIIQRSPDYSPASVSSAVKHLDPVQEPNFSLLGQYFIVLI